MKKSKIAISVDNALLEEVDRRVDGSIIRSRSQAIEMFLRKGLFESQARTAVILLKGDHQRYALEHHGGKSLIARQVEFFQQAGIETVWVITQRSDQSIAFMSELNKVKLPVKVIEDEAQGTAPALLRVKDKLREPFVVLSGDTFPHCDLPRMIRKTLQSPQVACMGLMTRSAQGRYGIAVLDGDLIVRFSEKPDESESLVVNAGIYVLKPEVFEQLDESMRSLEKDLFPRLAQKRELLGFFTHGEYVHAPESGKERDRR